MGFKDFLAFAEKQKVFQESKLKKPPKIVKKKDEEKKKEEEQVEEGQQAVEEQEKPTENVEQKDEQKVEEGEEEEKVKEMLIFDANSLSSYLYFSVLDSAYGGQYREYTYRVRHYFQSLQKCGFLISVVFSGSDPAKYSTPAFYTRTLTSLDASTRQQKFDQLQILPPLVHSVFLQECYYCQVSIHVAAGPAEGAIRALAKSHPNGLVVSGNHDLMLVTEIPTFVPLSQLRVDNYGVSLKRFSASAFASMVGVEPKMLYLMGILGATDLVPYYLLFPFHTYLFSQKSDSTKELIPALAQFLTKFSTPEEAIKFVLSMSWFTPELTQDPKFSQELFKENITSIFDSYKPTEEQQHYFDEDYILFKPLTAPEVEFPSWIIQAYKSGDIHKRYIQAAVTGEMNFPVIMDAIDHAPATNVSKELRELCYKLLLQKNDVQITENVRSGTKMVKVTATTSKKDVPSLAQIKNLPKSEQIEKLCSIFGSPNSIYEKVYEQYHLPILALRYWIKTATPHIAAWEIGVLLLSLSRTTDSKKMKLERPLWLNPRAVSFFAQWQSILEASMVLNRLFASPYQDMPIVDLYDGIFLHNVYNEVQKKKSVVDIFSKQKCNSQSFWNLYKAATQDLKDSISGQLTETNAPVKKGPKKVESTKKPIATFNDFNLLGEEKEESEEEEETEKVEEAITLPDINLIKEEFKTGGSWADDVDSKEQETEVKLARKEKKAEKKNQKKVVEQEEEEEEIEEEESEEEEETSSKSKAKPKKLKKKKEKIDDDVLDVLAQLKSIDTKKATQEKEKAAKKREKKLKSKMKKVGA